MRVVIAKNSAGRHSAWRWPEWLTERLRTEFPTVTFTECLLNSDGEGAVPEPTRRAFAEAEAAVAWRIPAELLAATPRLRWVHAPSSAVDEMLTPELARREIVLTHGSAVHAPPVVEHTLALLLALARGLPQAMRQQAQRQWQALRPEPGGVSELRGATVVLVGLGEIGSSLAPLLAALGMRVLGVRRNPERPTPGCAAVSGPEALDGLLPEADYVVLATPVTAGTRALIGAAQLGRMKASARLINVGRGALVDEAALVAALRSRRIAGAGLDVAAREPLPPESPLWDCDTALITPHIAGISPATWERQYTALAANLGHFLRGEPLEWVVNKAWGY